MVSVSIINDNCIIVTNKFVLKDIKNLVHNDDLVFLVSKLIIWTIKGDAYQD